MAYQSFELFEIISTAGLGGFPSKIYFDIAVLQTNENKYIHNSESS